MLQTEPGGSLEEQPELLRAEPSLLTHRDTVYKYFCHWPALFILDGFICYWVFNLIRSESFLSSVEAASDLITLESPCLPMVLGIYSCDLYVYCHCSSLVTESQG